MLVLPIKKKWYDMILSGEKKEECRRVNGELSKWFHGTKVSPSVSYKKMELLEARNNYLKEERIRQFLPKTNVVGSLA